MKKRKAIQYELRIEVWKREQGICEKCKKSLTQDIIYILQQLLNQKPYLGTYYQVEQYFVKNLMNPTK